MPNTLGDKHFVIGVPEGLQRIAALQKAKMSKLNFVCVPSLDIDHAGGLAGLFLHVRDLY